MLLHTMAEFIF